MENMDPLNIMSKTVPLNQLDLEFWQKRWTDGKIGWHKTQVNDLLEMYHAEMLPMKSKPRVFIPLCGKTVDMTYLANNHDCDVIGLEYTDKAITEFFTEQKLEHTTTSEGDFKIHKATGVNITIYQGDFFKANTQLIGEVDAIWDRGSLVAMNPTDRQKYADVIKSLMTSQTRYMLNALSYDQTRHGGPPFSVPLEVVQELFGEVFNIKELYSGPNPYSMDRFKLDWWQDSLYLMTKK